MSRYYTLTSLIRTTRETAVKVRQVNHDLIEWFSEHNSDDSGAAALIEILHSLTSIESDLEQNARTGDFGLELLLKEDSTPPKETTAL